MQISITIVRKRVIDDIVRGLLQASLRKSKLPEPMPCLLLKENEVTYFGQRLVDGNMDAIDQMYGNSTLDGVKLKYEINPKVLKSEIQPIRFYKSLQCYLANSYAGDVPDTELFQKLNIYCAKTAHSIVMSTALYRRLPWN